MGFYYYFIMTRSLHLYYFILTLAVVHGFIKSLSIKRTYHCVPQRFKVGSNTLIEELVISSINKPTGKVLFKDVRKVSIGLCKKDILSYRCKQKSAFYNCFVVIIRINNEGIFKEYHVKVFNTGKLEIPGIQTDKNFADVQKNILEILQKQNWQISEAAIINGIAKTKWPGRMQWINWKSQKLLIDGAHNPASATVLRNYVDSLNTKNITWVMGMLATKDHSDIFQELLKPGDKLYLVPVPDSNSADLAELTKLAISICPDLNFCHIYQDVFSALETAFSATDNQVVLCGSLYLIGNFLASLSDSEAWR